MSSPARDSAAEIRRGYIVSAGLALGVAVSNGLARFAYALVLPAMRADLAWNYTQAGALNTANAVGYLIGALIALGSVRQLGPSRLFVAAMWVTAGAILGMGLTTDFLAMIGLRMLAGVSGAVVFISGSVLAASVFPRQPSRSAGAIAIYFAGGGVGLLLPGLAIPWLIAAAGDGSWPWAWLGMGLFSGLVSLMTAAAARQVSAPAAQIKPHPWRKAPLLAIFASYACFALGYFAYMTFIVAWMREHGAGPVEVAGMWVVLGLATILSPRIWTGPIASWRGGRPLAAIQLAVGSGALLPLLGGSPTVMLASAVLFGSFFMVPAAITAFVKKALPAVVWGEAIATFTLLFSALQLVGPVVTGAVADRTGSLAWGLGVSGAVLILGALIALLQPERRHG
ncbi:MAG: YbfB/YjiJ family MFS transporter [Hyphomicrobiaceae bacterium]|nr:YbfB/YjiJ family MFS transporter [Hyphomicrobiaceae bacterium]